VLIVSWANPACWFRPFDKVQQFGLRRSAAGVGFPPAPAGLPPGSVGSARTDELLSRGRLIDLLHQGRQLADLIGGT
jgi:hypothetical protein